MPSFRTGNWNSNINVILTFPNRAHALQRVSRALDNYHKLPSYQQKMLTQYAEHLAAVRAAVETNHQFVQSIVDKAVDMFDNDPQFTIPNPVELTRCDLGSHLYSIAQLT